MYGIMFREHPGNIAMPPSHYIKQTTRRDLYVPNMNPKVIFEFGENREYNTKFPEKDENKKEWNVWTMVPMLIELSWLKMLVNLRRVLTSLEWSP